MHALRWIIRLCAVAAAAVIIYYATKDPERRTLDDAARASAPGKFVHLADGITHYEVAGPDTGRAVLFASAFSVPGFISDPLFQSLADSGFRVVRFDYYGRGWSDRIDAVYDQDLFVRQMAGLLDSLRIAEPVTLASISYGAAMVTSFADRYPGRVRAIIYLDPVFNNQRPLPPEERSRLAWDYHMVIQDGSNQMAEGQLYDFLYPDRHPDWVARYRVQQQFKGTREAWRRTRAAIAVAPDQAAQLRRVGSVDRPVLVIWGRQDPVAPFSESPAVMSALPHGTLVAIDSAGHMSHADQPALVLDTVIAFLRR